MQRSLRRIINLRLLIFTLVFAVVLIGSQTLRASAEEQKKTPYMIKVNRVYNTVTVYEQDESGNFTVPVKAMLCSVGKGGLTVTGTYKTKDKYRWKLLYGDVWGQYATRIVRGILFHSVYYYENCNPASLATKEYNKLGEAASHGCVRLAVKDAKWIYDNCSYGTTVVIYDDKKSAGPLGKPSGIKIASDVRWDPTDPSYDNPYADRNPAIVGVKNKKVTWGSSFDPLKGVKATSSVGTDITSGMKLKGTVDTTIPGEYKLTYSVKDALKKSVSKSITVTVLDNLKEPEFTGITDKAIKSGIPVDRDFALSGVEASCLGIKLEKDQISTVINKNSDTEYEITYSASIANGPDVYMTSKVTIDDEAPVLTGIADSTLGEGQILDEAYAMTGVTVSDNYSSSEHIAVLVSITDNLDGSYLVTYTATDEAGNTTTEQAKISSKPI